MRRLGSTAGSEEEREMSMRQMVAWRIARPRRARLALVSSLFLRVEARVTDWQRVRLSGPKRRGQALPSASIGNPGRESKKAYPESSAVKSEIGSRADEDGPAERCTVCTLPSTYVLPSLEKPHLLSRHQHASWPPRYFKFFITSTPRMARRGEADRRARESGRGGRMHGLP